MFRYKVASMYLKVCSICEHAKDYQFPNAQKLTDTYALLLVKSLIVTGGRKQVRSSPKDSKIYILALYRWSDKLINLP